MPRTPLWSCIPSDKWEELYANLVTWLLEDDQGFDHRNAAVEAGLDDEQTIALTAWVKDLEIGIEVRERTGELSEASQRAINDIMSDPPSSPEVERMVTEAVKRMKRAY